MLADGRYPAVQFVLLFLAIDEPYALRAVGHWLARHEVAADGERYRLAAAERCFPPSAAGNGGTYGAPAVMAIWIQELTRWNCCRVPPPWLEFNVFLRLGCLRLPLRRRGGDNVQFFACMGGKKPIRNIAALWAVWPVLCEVEHSDAGRDAA